MSDPHVAAIDAHMVAVHHGDKVLEVKPVAGGLRVLRNWEPVDACKTDLLALVEAMARALIALGPGATPAASPSAAASAAALGDEVTHGDTVHALE